MSDVVAVTPMLRHYLEVKAQHPDALLLYRMGDFFEMFFDDAREAAPLLEVVLTSRHKGSESEVPMCGVPFHALESYVGRLLAAGRRVVICDQVEDPRQAKGLVKREVTRILTPGTLSDPALIDGKEANLLLVGLWRENVGAAALLEVSTGHLSVQRWADPGQAVDDLEVLRPRELLLEPAETPYAISEWAARRGVCVTPLDLERLLEPRRAAESLKRHFGVSTLRGLGLEDDEVATLAAAVALAYGRETQKNDLPHIRALVVEGRDDSLVLDPTTLANLEIFRNLREGGRKGTLLGVLDRTVTAAGGRLLKEWLRRPLHRVEAIEERLAAVAELVTDGALRERLRAGLAQVADGERLLARAVLGSLPPREAAALRQTLEVAPVLLANLASASGGLLRELASADPCAELAAELRQGLADPPAASLKDGGVIAEGVDAELDRYRSLARDSKQVILSLELQERERTGIPSLKIRYNKVFGYYLEITHAHQARVPPEYIRKQTLVNAERYITPEIKQLEEEILGAEEKQLALEERYYARLQQAVVRAGAGLSSLAGALAALDVLAALAEVAVAQRYCRPVIAEAGEPIVLSEGRHPVVELTSREAFVPNDTELDADTAQLVLLTGPNMGGKSTYLRQVALTVLMAQLGSFVPASSASIGVVDRIFCRVGASDDLARGESTFMVEMIETANILHQASERSLVILDEVGRGTATFDGLSLAWAIVEYLHEVRRPKTLFATHYHELTELASLLPRVVNRKMAVKEWEERILFLRRVVPGSADKSYGLQVARLAGLPGSVIARAGEILKNLEAQEYDFTGKPRLARGASAPTVREEQLSLFTPPEQTVAEVLRATDLDQLTPLAALNLVASLKARL
jgi:DNA mismatch repair protein MutS